MHLVPAAPAAEAQPSAARYPLHLFAVTVVVSLAVGGAADPGGQR